MQSTPPATHQLDGGIHSLHQFGCLAGVQRVLTGLLMTDLPGAIHLIAQIPVLHSGGFRVTILTSQVSVVRIAPAVAILHPGGRLVQGTSA